MRYLENVGLDLFLQVDPGPEETQGPLRHFRVDTLVDSQQGFHILFFGLCIEIDALDEFTKHVEIDFGGLADDRQFFGLRVEDRLANDIRIDIGKSSEPGDEFR